MNFTILALLVAVLLVAIERGSVTSSTIPSDGNGDDTGLDEYIIRLRRKYNQKFQNTCMKYPFVQRHIELLENPPGKFVMFVVQEPGQLPSTTGGLGDRLSGLITAAAYALRVNRTLLIVGESPFEDLFVPYYVPSSPDNTQHNFTYTQWAWAKWEPKYVIDMHWERCVNPKKGHIACGLDYDYFHDTKALKYYCNRTYLCRWLAERRLGLGKELKDILGIDESTDLYEVAGCLLRLAIHPTELMWKSLRNLVKDANVRNIHFGTDASTGSPDADIAQTATSNTAFTMTPMNPHSQKSKSKHGTTNHDNRYRYRQLSSSSSSSLRSVSAHTTPEQKQEQLLIGIHFRCGDASFHESRDTPPNPQCVFISNETWKGTAFRDDISYDSPLDLARCANHLADSTSNGKSSDITSHSHDTIPKPPPPPPGINVSHHSHFDHSALFNSKDIKHVVYIASDNMQSMQQIIGKLAFRNVLNQPKSCHVDEQHSLDCATSTLTQWFFLSLSDYIITQSADSAIPTAYLDNPAVISHLQNGIIKPKPPISAFSRTAAIYSLQPGNLRFGSGCVSMNSTTMGHFTHGNWICTPHMFY